MRCWLQFLAVKAGLPTGMDRGIDSWEAEVTADGDELTVSVIWDTDHDVWHAWVGPDDEPDSEKSPDLDSPQAAMAWLVAKLAAHKHVPCGDCDDSGIVEGFRDGWSHTHGHYTETVREFCECKFGRRAAAEEPCYD